MQAEQLHPAPGVLIDAAAGIEQKTDFQPLTSESDSEDTPVPLAPAPLATAEGATFAALSSASDDDSD